MIQYTEDMTLSFYLPVPLNQGCQLTVELPSDYSTDDIEYVGSLQVFGSYREFVTADNNLVLGQNTFTINPCRTYINNDNIAVLYISKLRHFNYEIKSGSFKILIQNSQGLNIA